MALVKGVIGFVIEEEVEEGMWLPTIAEKTYSGTCEELSQAFAFGNTTNGELRIRNKFSLMGNSYFFSHVADIRYFVWQNQKWVIENLQLKYPRFEFTIGGIYHEQKKETSEYSSEDTWG